MRPAACTSRKFTATMSAAIVNAHCEYVIANMRSAFPARGKQGVEMAWRHAYNFPQHRCADVFDIVIEDVLASDGRYRRI